MSNAQCVLLNGHLFIGGFDASGGASDKIFVSPTDLRSWDTWSTPVRLYALTSCNSNIVLVGGTEYDPYSRSYKVTNKLFTSSTGYNWQPSLPAMPTKRSLSSVLSIESPRKCLVVAGGVGVDYSPLDTVEALVDNQWSTLQPLPHKCCDMKLALHNGIIYLMGGIGQHNLAYHCMLDTLIGSLQRIDYTPMWNEILLPYAFLVPVSFESHLTVVAKEECATKILVKNESIDSWVHAGDVPHHLKGVSLEAVTVITLPSGELVMLGGRKAGSSTERVFKASLIGE